jgi:hypothetical protein
VINKGSTVLETIISQFVPGAPPSPIPVRDPKRKKTTEEENSNENKIKGVLAGSL